MVQKIMRAAVFEKIGKLTVKEVPVPVIERPDQIIVKIEMCSICGTDVHIMEVPPGYDALPGTILGHELVGEVVEIGSGVRDIKVGDRVVCNPNDYCGACEYCKKNLPNFCTNIECMGIEVNGGFAEYVRITEKVAFKIDPSLPAEIAAFAEPLACIMNGKNKIMVQPGNSVLVCGGGKIGLMFVQLMKACGAKPVFVTETIESRRCKALECGADYVINPLETDVQAFIAEKTGIGCDFAIDAVGSQMATCAESVRKGGTVLIFGINGKVKYEFAQGNLTNREVAVLGTWIANASFPPAVRILESGVLSLDKLITKIIPLEEICEGIETLARGEGTAILVDPRK